MTGLVQSETNGPVCHITMRDGSDNRLSHSMCHSLRQELKSAFEADDVHIVLLTGDGSYFSAGLDLGALSSAAVPSALFDLVDLLVEAPKPVIAGLNGHAFGAGFEIALLCALRLATPDAQIGFPDVLHGLPPGAGASQTLPRILGAKHSLQLLLSGDAQFASDFSAVIDAEIQGDFLSGALRFAQSLAAQDLSAISVENRIEGLSDPAAFQGALVAARAARNADNVVADDIINAVETALLLPFSAGVAAEREVFKAAEARPNARAMRHLVHQRAQLQVRNKNIIGADLKLERIAIVGDGDLSQLCAARLLLAGTAVTHVHSGSVTSEDLRFDVLDIVRQEFDDRGGGVLHEAQLSDRLSVGSELSDCATADLVLDVSEEDPNKLASRAKALNELLPGHVGLVVASQFFGFATVQDAFARPSQTAKLWVESDLDQEFCAFSIGGKPQPSMRRMVLSLVQTLGITGIETKLEAGAIVGALWLKMLEAAETLCIAGTPVSAIDNALSLRGFVEGPFHMADSLGLDVIDGLIADLPYIDAQLPISHALAANGHTGIQAGMGYYLYEGERAGLPNPEGTRVIHSLREERGQKLTASNIQQYCLAVFANEVARLVSVELVRSAGEIDLLLTDALGLSPQLGGPLHAADSEGLLHLRYQLTGKDGRPTPCSSLLEMIKNGLNFKVLDAEIQSAS